MWNLMKKLSLLLAILMLLSCCSAFAEEPAGPTEAELLAQPCNFAIIEADGAQPRLTYIEGLTNIIEVDGLKFKDMNGNGKLDIYEDYRRPVDARVSDLISQMTYEEEAGLLFCVSAKLDTAREMIPSFKNNCMLFNLNGTPIEVTNTLNNLQAAAEAERLSIPMTFTSDREYNSWGGYIDKAHRAFGNANDPELAYELAYIYGKAMVAIGIHVTFEPYANEIGAQYGENPELIANVIAAEIRGLEDSGFASCTKHWIGRGGDSSFEKARSVAQNFDNWMVGWKAAIDNGCEWVMTNCDGTGITNTVDPKWDSVTMGYLRDTLGFDGVVVTDWWALRATQTDAVPTPEGVMLKDQSIAWLYDRALELGTDVFGAGSMNHGTDPEAVKAKINGNWPDVIIEGLYSGEVKKINVDQAATRVLRFKFNKGLFEDPYRVIDEMLAVTASPEWIANPTPITSNEDLRAARPAHEVELAEALQAKSAVLLKNEGGLLPLQKGIKVYVEATNDELKNYYKKYIADYATVVENIADADVAVGDFTAYNDVLDYFIEDVQAAGKPMVMSLNGIMANALALTEADALLYMSYSQKPDHGSGTAGMVYSTEPWVYAEMLFGVKEPGGVITKEIARDSFADAAQWKDLAGDQGASTYVRLMVQATMEDAAQHASPNNWGDPLVIYNYGMAYGAQPEWKYSCLVLPQVYEEVETANSRGQMVKSVVGSTKVKAGEPFTVYALLRNVGEGDGMTIAQAYANGELAAEKIMTVEAGSWRVLQMELTLDAGEYVITVGDQSGTLVVE